MTDTPKPPAVRAKITASNADLVETAAKISDLEEASKTTRVADQTALRIDPDAPADSRAKVHAQLERQYDRHAGLTAHLEALQADLHRAEYAETHAAMVPRIAARIKRTQQADKALDSLERILRAHIEEAAELGELHRAGAYQLSANTRGPENRYLYDSERLIASWLRGRLGQFLRLDDVSPSAPSSLQDLDNAVL